MRVGSYSKGRRFESYLRNQFNRRQHMIGMYLTHIPSGITGVIDAQSVQPDGMAIVRINDHWFPADEVGLKQ